ncbi:MAG: CgeB family protein [Terriglobales bacterium]
MRLAIFGLSVTSSWGNGHATTYRGLLRGLHLRGHEVDFFERDVEWYARHRDLPCPEHARLRLYQDWPSVAPAARQVAREADAVIVGSYFPDAVALLDDLLGHAGPPVCFYDIDTPVTLASLRRGQCAYLRADQIPAVDLYLSFTGGPMLSELNSLWGARLVRPLYCACDEDAYRTPRRPAASSCTLSFLGTFAPDRQAKLERLLLQPAKLMPQHRFQVAGPMFPHPEQWPGNVHYVSHLAPAQHRAFYAGSRFTLNLTRQAMVEAGYSPSVRLFEAAAAATPIISDPWPGLTDFFEPGREILVAQSSQEVVEMLKDISADAAAAMGRAAQARALSAHTCVHRARELESYLALVTATAPSYTESALKVR